MRDFYHRCHATQCLPSLQQHSSSVSVWVCLSLDDCQPPWAVAVFQSFHPGWVGCSKMALKALKYKMNECLMLNNWDWPLIYKNKMQSDWKKKPTYNFYLLEMYWSCALYTQLAWVFGLAKNTYEPMFKHMPGRTYEKIKALTFLCRPLNRIYNRIKLPDTTLKIHMKKNLIHMLHRKSVNICTTCACHCNFNLNERKITESLNSYKCIKLNFEIFGIRVVLNFKSAESLVWANCTNVMLLICFQYVNHKFDWNIWH